MSSRHPQSYLCGCGYVVGPTKHYLNRVQLDAHTTILSSTSRTTLKQIFSNPSSTEVKECLYTFPLFDGVSVVAFTCRIGSRLLRGVVKERTQAKATFDQAVSRRETAGYLEQLPEASDVLTTHLGNIPANGEVHVDITYVGELKHDAEADGIRFTLPTRIAPRYGTLVSFQSNVGSNVREDGGIKITVDASVAEGSFIRGIQSPSHPIAVTMGSTSTSDDVEVAMHKASATLSLGSTELEKDFVLIVLNKDVGTPKAILERHPTLPNQRALMLTLVPKFSLPRSNPEIVFVADRSGSMNANIPTLVASLKVFLKSLPVGVSFNICSFGSRHSFLWPKSKPYSRETLNEALDHLETFGADYGGTETFAALKATIENRYTDIPCEVMLLTDGDIWNQEELFRYLNDEIKKSKSSLRVFALGIGNGVSHALIEGVARAGNGFAQTVSNNEKLDSKVIRMLKGGLSPHTTDYSLEVNYRHEEADEGFEMVEKVTDALKVMLSEEKSPAKPEVVKENKPVSFFDNASEPAGQEKPPSADNDNTDPFTHLPAISVPKFIQTPQDIPPLYPFSRTTVYLLLSDDDQKTPRSVTLRAKSEHGPLELEIPVEELSTPGQTIHQLAARKAILELEEHRGWIYEAKGADDTGTLLKDRYPSRFDEMVRREAVRIGVRFQVGSKWSSFVAVQANDGVDAAATTTSSSGLEAEVDKDGKHDSMGFGFVHVEPPPTIAPHTGGALFRSAAGVASLPPMTFQNKNASTRSRAAESYAVPLAQQGLMSARSSRISAYDHGMAVPSPTSGLFDATGSRKRPAARGGGGGHKKKSVREGVPSWAGDDESAAAAPPSAAAPKTDNEKVHAVIEMQDFEGWWQQSEALAALLGARKIEASRTKEWVTMLVVKWFEVRMKGEGEVWELVADKAMAWLQEQVMGDQEMKRMEDEVLGYLE
ncbi:MAG: hypothetical protein LQ345_003357 [Seirophora villosa]|nr:MAG: hypothetical protein LQ345_003357 [Seirophora villosa]